LAGSNQFIAYTDGVDSAEALALQHGLELALHWGCDRIVVNSDSLTVVEAMKSEEIFLVPAAATINECQKLSKEFVIVTFHHCPREANGAADELARHADRSLRGNWQVEPPNFLLPQLVKDLTIIE
jgi:ribonuclease HI